GAGREQRERVGAGGEVDAAAPDGAELDGVRAGAAGDGLDVGNCHAVGAVEQCQAVAAGAEVDGGGHGCTERDGVVLAAAGDGFDGGDGQRVLAGRGQGQ